MSSPLWNPSAYSPHYQPPARVQKPARLNDEERRQWIENDEGLYNWQRRSRLSMREFIRQNRTEIDAAILSCYQAGANIRRIGKAFAPLLGP